MTDRKQLTVGELREFLKSVPPETEITFGASKYRKGSLIFYRLKTRGKKLLQIELNDIDQGWESISEIDCRPQAKDFLRQLEIHGDDEEITFRSSMDAVPLEFRSIAPIVAINLEENEEPE